MVAVKCVSGFRVTALFCPVARLVTMKPQQLSNSNSNFTDHATPSAQQVLYAAQRHTHFLPDGKRAGFFIGDGAGVGKGRQVSHGAPDKHLAANRIKSQYLFYDSAILSIGPLCKLCPDFVETSSQTTAVVVDP